MTKNTVDIDAMSEDEQDAYFAALAAEPPDYLDDDAERADFIRMMKEIEELDEMPSACQTHRGGVNADTTI